MAKFKYYITDFYNGEITGTNSAEAAKDAALCGDFLVVEAETGQWLQDDGTRAEVKEYEGA